MSWSVVATVLPIAPLNSERSQTFLSSSPFMASRASSFSPSSSSSEISYESSAFQTSLLRVTERQKAETVPRSNSRCRKQICKAANEYKFPDPIPEFAEAETEKFRTHLINKLSKKDIYEDSAEEIINICTEIFSNFLHTEYGGPGTLMVVPFIDMADTVHERGLPGASQAARMAVKWAQNHVDKDWKEWTGSD